LWRWKFFINFEKFVAMCNTLKKIRIKIYQKLFKIVQKVLELNSEKIKKRKKNTKKMSFFCNFFVRERTSNLKFLQKNSSIKLRTKIFETLRWNWKIHKNSYGTERHPPLFQVTKVAFFRTIFAILAQLPHPQILAPSP